MKPFAFPASMAATILLLAAPNVTHADCPLSLYRFGAGPAFESSTQTQSFSFGSPGSCDSGSASWDLSVGKLALALKPCARDSAKCRIRDTFVINEGYGLPAGTPVQVYVLLDWATSSTEPCGLNGCQVKHTVVVRAGANADSATYTQPFVSTAAIAYHAIIGQPFDVSAMLAIEAPEGGEGHSTGDLRFHMQFGTLSSCNGYNEQPTPATRTSWGRLRVAYR